MPGSCLKLTLAPGPGLRLLRVTLRPRELDLASVFRQLLRVGPEESSGGFGDFSWTGFFLVFLSVFLLRAGLSRGERSSGLAVGGVAWAEDDLFLRLNF